MLLVLMVLFAGPYSRQLLASSPHPAIKENVNWRMRPVKVEGDQEKAFSYNEVRPQGLWAERIQNSLNRLMNLKDGLCNYIGWGGDQAGRWIGATSTLAAITGTPIDKEIRGKVQMLIDAQDSDGLFYGDKLKEEPKGVSRQLWFGQGRALWNLQEYCRITGDAEAFQALLKAADYTSSSQITVPIPNGLYCGIESSLGPMVVLGQLTGRKQYIDYARYVADNLNPEIGATTEWFTSKGEVDPTKIRTHYGKNGHQSHSYLSVTQGMVDLAMATGDDKYLQQAIKIFEENLPMVWVNGGVPEHYACYYEYNQETCSMVDWVVLCLKLYNATGQARYLDAAELSILNALPFDQINSRSFICQRSVNRHHHRGEHGNRGYVADFCCTMSGPWLMGQATTQAITANEKGFSMNLPLDIDATTHRNAKAVKISQRIHIRPHDILQSIQVFNGDTSGFDLKIRMPYWCEKPLLRIDGKDQELKAVNGFAHVNCPANSVLAISVKLPMSLQIVPPGRSLLTKDTGGDSGVAPEKGLQYGPFALMFNRQMYPDVTEHDIAVTVSLKDNGHPFVDQNLPDDWTTGGAVPILIKAQLKGGKKVLLTPCANLTMTKLTVDDPYILRFSEVALFEPEAK